jgi:hypothetical protein
VKYFLDQLTPVLDAIALDLAWEGNRYPNYIEQVRSLERVLRELYPESPEDHAAFGAALALHAVLIGIGAAEHRRQEIEARAEEHVELVEQQRAIKQAQEQGSDDLLRSYLTETKPTKLS